MILVNSKNGVVIICDLIIRSLLTMGDFITLEDNPR